MAGLETEELEEIFKPSNRPILFVEGSNVRQLKESDFTLDKKELVSLNFDDCVLALFYSNNKESEELCKIWAKVASQSAGAIFCACHLGLEKKVTENFIKLRNVDSSHANHWVQYKGNPFILVYRQGWIAAMYKGSKTEDEILNYSLYLACNPNYTEKRGINITKTSSEEFVTKKEEPVKEEIVIEKATSKGNIAMPIKRSVEVEK